MADFHDSQTRHPVARYRFRRIPAAGPNVRARLAVLLLVFFVLAVPACSGNDGAPAFPSSRPAPSSPAASPTGRPDDAGEPPATPKSQPPVPAPTSSPGQGGGTASDFASFQQDCEKGVARWRVGQVDYPSSLSVPLGQATDYNAAVDVRDNPLPPDQVIDSGEPASEQVAVRCLLAAKLVPVGEHIKVNGAPAVDWAPRQFTPSGVMEWTWSVTAEKPVDQQLRLVLVPAVLIEGTRYVYGSDSEASLLTRVSVEATPIERVSYWFETQWPLLVGIAVVLAAAVAATRKWIQEQFKKPRRRTAGKRAPKSRPSR